MKVRDIMQRAAATVAPDDPLSTAVQVMLWCGSRHLPVTEDGGLVGVLSERDVLRFRAESGGPLVGAAVREAMTAPAQWVSPDEPAAAAAARMAASRIGCLPVVAPGEPIGIVTATDLMRALEAEHFVARAEPGEATAAALMSTDVVTIEADDSLADAAARMSQYRIRHLPVVDGDGRLIGMLSDRDLRLPPDQLREPQAALSTYYLERTRVRSVMSEGAYEVSPDAPLLELMTALGDWRVSALPVVDDERRVLGMISYVDVLRGLRTPRQALDEEREPPTATT